MLTKIGKKTELYADTLLNNSPPPMVYKKSRFFKKALQKRFSFCQNMPWEGDWHMEQTVMSAVIDLAPGGARSW